MVHTIFYNSATSATKLTGLSGATGDFDFDFDLLFAGDALFDFIGDFDLLRFGGLGDLDGLFLTAGEGLRFADLDRLFLPRDLDRLCLPRDLE